MAIKSVTYSDDRIAIDPEICNGRPTIRGTRITVETILGYLGAGDNQDEILQNYPSLQAEDIQACLAFAARLMRHKYSVLTID